MLLNINFCIFDKLSNKNMHILKFRRVLKEKLVSSNSIKIKKKKF